LYRIRFPQILQMLVPECQQRARHADHGGGSPYAASRPRGFPIDPRSMMAPSDPSGAPACTEGRNRRSKMGAQRLETVVDNKKHISYRACVGRLYNAGLNRATLSPESLRRVFAECRRRVGASGDGRAGIAAVGQALGKEIERCFQEIFDERSRRLVAASEARSLGFGKHNLYHDSKLRHWKCGCFLFPILS
jgi:hypothetical protein